MRGGRGGGEEEEGSSVEGSPVSTLTDASKGGTRSGLGSVLGSGSVLGLVLG